MKASKIPTEKSFGLWPRNESGAFVATLMLSLSKADGATEKNGGKEGTIHLCSAWVFEDILTLLTKVVAIYVEFTLIGLQGPSL